MTSPAEQLCKGIEQAGLLDALPIEFYQELHEHGVESLEHFEDCYQGQYFTEADFVEQILNDCYDNNLPSWVAIDYQKTWDDSLSWDYFSVKTGVERYEIFRNVY